MLPVIPMLISRLPDLAKHSLHLWPPLQAP
jgi:hypothetical protein